VTWADALEAHAAALEAGGRPGILNQGLIESALARPYNGRHRSIHKKAAALVHSLAKNHGFVDGNKRTALYMADLLVRRSDYSLNANSDAVEQMILDMVENRMDYTNAI
jgi:death on curing protein